VVVPHGAPEFELGRQDELKTRFGWNDRFVALSLGLLGPGKGIEMMINALPAIVQQFPNFLYAIGGVAHPDCGPPCRAYVDYLKSTVQRLNRTRNVQFMESFLEDSQIHEYLQATDFFVALYSASLVTSSGTVSSALAAGRVVVATPFVYAREMLRFNQGVLVRFNDPVSVSAAVVELCRNDEKRKLISDNAYRFGQRMRWNSVAAQYSTLLEEIVQEDQVQ